MVALAKQDKRPFDAVVVWSTSRFGRNMDECTVNEAFLRKQGRDNQSSVHRRHHRSLTLVMTFRHFVVLRTSVSVGLAGIPAAHPSCGFPLDAGRPFR